MEPENDRDVVRVRPATIVDWPTLWPLLQGMGHATSESGSRERLARLLRREDHRLAIAVSGYGPHSSGLGYAWVQDYGPHLRSGRSTARLSDLFVDPQHRRRGIGGLLLQSVLVWASERGVTWLQWQSSPSAAPFYGRLGLVGDPCPDPGHPFYEVDFSDAGWRAKLGLG